MPYHDPGDAEPVQAHLWGANLSGADLRGANLRHADLSATSFWGADLWGADLVGADLRGANLSAAELSAAELSGANLRDAAGLPVVTPIAGLHAKILAAIDAGGSLYMVTWHLCETTHCHAGWAIHLAGDEGEELEFDYYPSVAGALIVLASCPSLNGVVPNWRDSEDRAMATIRRLAAIGE